MNLFHSLVPNFQRSPATASAPRASDVGPTVRPLYEVKETDDAYGLTVQLPGVAKEGLEITAEDNQLRIVGRRAWKRPAEWATLYRESSEAAYQLVLSHDHTIDLEKIHAELRDGVLRLSLPKAEAIKPRKITVS